MLRRLILALSVAALPAVATAQPGQLQSLENGVDADAWEAVGRLDIGGRGFCTGALIAPALVLTAAHCLFDKHSGARINHETIEFLAGWRNGRASAYRTVRRAVILPEYSYSDAVSSDRVRNDVALLELVRPIRNTTIRPFDTADRPLEGDSVGVVSYARDRSEAPSLQELCTVLSRQEGILVTSCSVDFGSSGAPIFVLTEGRPHIVSVVSAKAEMDGANVSLGTALDASLDTLRAALLAGEGVHHDSAPVPPRVTVGAVRRDTGAKFVRPDP